MYGINESWSYINYEVRLGLREEVVTLVVYGGTLTFGRDDDFPQIRLQEGNYSHVAS